MDDRGTRYAVVEALAFAGERLEKTVDRAELRIRRFRRVDLVAERSSAGEILCVPGEVLPGDARARALTVERVVVGKMHDDCRAGFLDGRWRRSRAMVEKMADLAEDPGPALRGTTDHHAVRAGVVQHVLRWSCGGASAVADHRVGANFFTAANVFEL